MTLADLQQKFIERLDGRLNDLAVIVESAPNAEPLMRLFHSLSGIAGTYGYDDITDISRECERICLESMDQHRSLSDLERTQLRHCLAQARKCAATISC